MSDTLVGTNPQAVLELLQRRKKFGRGDGRRLALIVEGGGMRGVLSAGSLLAVDVLGFRDAFDEVYATSSGAVNAAYFLSGQGALGITVYFDSISNRRFYNPLRIMKIVDVEYVYDHIVARVKVLDDAAIRGGRAEFFISVTDALTGENSLVNAKEAPEPIPLILKASSALPVLYNRTVELGGRAYVDGGLTCSIPIVQAVERGCTDVLVLLTRTHGYEVAPPTWSNRFIFYALQGRKYPELMRSYAALDARANRDRRVATGQAELPGVNVATICPTEAELVVDRTTIERARLVEGAHRMARRVARVFGEDAAVLDRMFADYRRVGVSPARVAVAGTAGGHHGSPRSEASTLDF